MVTALRTADMAARSRSGVQVRRMRSARSTAGRAPTPYRQMRAAIALGLALFLFVALWVLNGEFTANFVVGLTHADPAWGWSTHILITAVELMPAFLAEYIATWPRRLRLVIWLLAIPFGVFDVLSSALGVAPYLTWTPAEGIWIHVQNVAAAEVISYLPEPMIVFLFVAFVTVLRGK